MLAYFVHKFSHCDIRWHEESNFGALPGEFVFFTNQASYFFLSISGASLLGAFSTITCIGLVRETGTRDKGVPECGLGTWHGSFPPPHASFLQTCQTKTKRTHTHTKKKNSPKECSSLKDLVMLQTLEEANKEMKTNRAFPAFFLHAKNWLQKFAEQALHRGSCHWLIFR